MANSPLRIDALYLIVGHANQGGDDAYDVIPLPLDDALAAELVADRRKRLAARARAQQ
jgi:hypothetical protein